MTHYSRYELEQYFSGEETTPEVGAHLNDCAQCNQLVAQMRKEQNVLLHRESAAQFAARVQQSAETAAPPPNPFFAAFKPTALAWSLGAALLLCGIGYFSYDKIETTQHAETAVPPGLRWKGASPVVEVFVNRDNEVIFSKNNFVLPGDKVQYRVTVPGGQTGYAALVAIEGNTAKSIFPPDQLNLPLTVRGATELPGAVLIEKDTTDLSLVLVLKDRPFKIDELLRAMNDVIDENQSVANVNGVVNIQRTRSVSR